MIFTTCFIRILTGELSKSNYCGDDGTGLLNRTELSRQIDHLIVKPEIQRLHNQYFLAVEVNATRDVPESDVATWVSHQGKINSAPKAVTGDAHERRLKKEVMSLPARDRRRMKEIPDVCFYVSMFQAPLPSIPRSLVYMRYKSTISLGIYVQNQELWLILCLGQRRPPEHASTPSPRQTTQTP